MHRRNEFADMSNAEFRSVYTGGLKRREDIPAEAVDPRFLPGAVLAGAALDWRSKGAVTSVK